MNPKNLIVLLSIIVIIFFSNYYFIFYTPKQLEKYTTWRLQTVEEKFQSEIVLTRYYNSQYNEENVASVRSSLADLRALNKNYMEERECPSYIEFKKNVDYNISILDSLAKIKPNYLTPFIFTQTVLSLQNNLDNILIKIEMDNDSFKQQTELLSFIMSFCLILIISLFLIKYDKKRKRMGAQHDAIKNRALRNLELKNKEYNETTYLQTSLLQESVEKLEKLIDQNNTLHIHERNDLEENLKDIKEILVELNLYSQSSIQSELTPCELYECFEAIFNYYQLHHAVVNNIPRGVKVAYDKQDILLLIKYLFRAIQDNKSNERDLMVVVDSKVEDKWIHISIEDNGNGLSVDELKSLFKFQISKPTDFKKERINSFQYVLIHKIITDYGGSIWVESTPHKGSIFHFSLPLSDF